MLISDWERSTKHGKPRPLPRKPAVADILRGYVTKAQAGKVGRCCALHGAMIRIQYFLSAFGTSMRQKFARMPDEGGV